MINLDNLDIKEWLSLNSALQKKKNAVRKALKERGVLKREGKNAFDKYTYFSEAQYKDLFTGLFAEHGLDLSTTEETVEAFVTPSTNMPNGRKVTLSFVLSDIDTGFFERSNISGEGFDKGDKGIYKAYTGAVKYYLASTFLVATGDDAEKDENRNEKTPPSNYKRATAEQVTALEAIYTGNNLTFLLAKNKVKALTELSEKKAAELILLNKTKNKGV